MDYRRMGRSGLKVSEICLGTMTFGHGADEGEAGRILDACLEAGVNFIDTANSYNGGATESILGNILRERRRRVVLASKVFNPMGDGPNDSGASRAHIMQAVEDSLRRLGTDYLDIYYLHHVDHDTPLEESLCALDDLVRQGKIRYAGVSNYEAWRLMEALWTSDSKGLARFECYQPQYSLVVRDIEQEIVPVCEAKGLGVVVWSPLAGGYLTGKYQPGQDRATGSRSEEGWAFPQRFFHTDHTNVLATLLEVAAELGRSPAVLDQGFVTAAIVGARNQAQIEETLQAVGWRLPDALRARLDTASALPLRYPRTMEDGMRERRAAAVRIG
jgi:aryl-alcohol dehydrogenase-like predicted oxidoreductase